MSNQYHPRDYQKTCIKFLLQRGCAGLFLDPGLGKTSICLAAFKVLRREGLVRRALIVAPLRVIYEVWPEQVKHWQDFNELKIAVLHGKNKSGLLRSASSYELAAINPEGLSWLLENTDQKKWPWDVLIVDESTRFKNTRSLRFQTLKKMLHHFSRRVILTGTPAPRSLLDLFGQIYLLDAGATLGQYITHYRLNYFTPTGYGGYDWKPQPGAEKRIYAKLNKLVLRMDANDHLELPQLVFNNVTVDLPEDARRQYDQMEATLLTAVNGELISAANVGVASMKCRQIAGGGLYVNGSGAALHTAKLDAVEELVEELNGKPALIAYEFKHELDRLRERFGKKTPALGGDTTPRETSEIIRAWNAGEIPVLLAHPQSAGHGLNMQGTSAAVIWYSLPWDLELYDQFIRRVWRQGQKHRVVVHHVVARNTIDEAMLLALRAKQRRQNALLDALRRYARRPHPR